VQAVADDTATARFLKKRSFSIAGHRTSIALEPEFWSALEFQAVRSHQSLSAFVASVDATRGARPLASALRLAALASVPAPRRTV
jgi:predicted DNA-binding ribbon-helix-helix protein